MTEKLYWLHRPVFTTKSREEKRKRTEQEGPIAESRGRAVSDGSTATPRGEMTALQVTKKIGTLHLLK